MKGKPKAKPAAVRATAAAAPAGLRRLRLAFVEAGSMTPDPASWRLHPEARGSWRPWRI